MGQAVALWNSGAGATTVLRDRAQIPNDLWLQLSDRARLVSKDPRTTREITLVGPALAQVCVASREEAWLVSGGFESSTGTGEAPGAEQWVATPIAVVRYGAARLRLDVSATQVALRLNSGEAFVWAPADARVERGGGAARSADAGAASEAGWQRLDEGTAKVLLIGSRPAQQSASAATDQCERSAQRASGLARVVLSQDAGSDGAASLGQAIAAQVIARRAARAACGLAAVRDQGLPASKAHEALTKRLDGANTSWQDLP
jgi:hypothetical protein